MMRKRCLAYAACAAGLVLSFGCETTPQKYMDPIAVMMNKTEGHRHRWAAARQAEQEMRTDPRRIEALQKLVWLGGYPTEYRVYAIDQLIELDEAEAKRFFASALVLMRDWPSMQHLMDRAVERKWVDYTPALVRNYAQRTPVYRDVDRPERKAIEALHPGEPVESVVMRVFVGEFDADARQRAGAWTLLHRLTDDTDALIERLLTLKAEDDPMVADLQAGARDLHVMPDSTQTVTWLKALRSLHPEFWRRSAEVVATLDAPRRRGLELRHLPVLLHLHDTDPSALALTREQLLDTLTRHIAAQKRHLIGPRYDGPMDEHPQELTAWQDQLAWGDLQTMRLVTRWMSDRRMVSDWFAQAAADEQDKSTEYGGLVLIDDQGRAYPQLYRPMMREHDLIYYAPKELVLDGYTALAHYHFHAQSLKNSLYAGPGLGDLDRIADTQRFSALVLTFIDSGRLNVDYYQRGRIVVDLGTITK